MAKRYKKEQNPFRAKSLVKVRECVLSHLQNDAVKVILFGSSATRNARRGSDIDVAVQPEGEWKSLSFLLLKEKLSELPIPYTVDLVNLNEVDERFRQNIINEGIVWRE